MLWADRKKYSKELGHPITDIEIRLMPYLMTCAMDQRTVDNPYEFRSHVSREEWDILVDWVMEGKLSLNPCVSFSGEFLHKVVVPVIEGSYLVCLEGETSHES
ncbi:MAG: hypothetical protein LKE37_05020 [Atopobiaceae bacterium]|jgi:hypothetical protein|nr:hypothetical protein [Atopobiaceae bacterium]